MRWRTLWLSSLAAILLSGCMVSTPQGPLSTASGRDAAVEAYVELGLGYLQKGQNAQAKIPLQKALMLDNSSASAHAALALVFQAERENKLAEEHFKHALTQNPSSRISNNYAGFLYQQGRYTEALDYFTQAATDPLYSGRARVYENMGLTALKLQQPAIAKQHFLRALNLDTHSPQALFNLAEMAFINGQYSQAQAYHQQLMALNVQPDAPSLWLGYRLGRQLNESTYAAGYLAELQRLYPGSSEYRQYLSEQQ